MRKKGKVLMIQHKTKVKTNLGSQRFGQRLVDYEIGDSTIMKKRLTVAQKMISKKLKSRKL